MGGDGCETPWCVTNLVLRIKYHSRAAAPCSSFSAHIGGPILAILYGGFLTLKNTTTHNRALHFPHILVALFVLLYGGFLTLKNTTTHHRALHFPHILGAHSCFTIWWIPYLKNTTTTWTQQQKLRGMRFKKINPSISTSRVILKFKGLHIFAIFLRYQDSANVVSDSGELVSALSWIKAPLSEMNKVAMIHWI